LYTPAYYVFENALPSEVLQSLRREGANLKLVPGAIGPDSAQVKEKRHSLVGFFAADHWVNGLLYHYAALANARSWRYSLVAPTPSQYAEYEEGCYFDWHADYAPASDGQTVERKITVVLNISEHNSFSGGHFEVRPNWVEPESPVERLDAISAAGSVVVFPSMTPHRVLPIEKGQRHSITTWVAGPPMR